MTPPVTALWNDESGQGLVEYALILGFVSIVAAGALITMSESVKKVFSMLNGYLITAEANVK